MAQAVYSGGSLFNHSCEPNIHAYFLSRTLFMRATESVTAGSEMELSYGPQVIRPSILLENLLKIKYFIQNPVQLNVWNC